MANKYTGVQKNSDGIWYYRIKVKSPSGKLIDTRIKQDTDGLPFKTAKAASEARASHLASIKLESPYESVQGIVTLEDVYNDYLNTEAKMKAVATLRKQDSMWKNHIAPEFGKRDINSIDIVELNSFLFNLYYGKNYAYKYVEGFLKFFYLLFGHANKREWIEIRRYNKMFVTRGTQLSMPKINQLDKEEEEKGATTYDMEQIEDIEQVFQSEEGNLLLAFYLGLYAGLRIGECFALRWSNIDFSRQTITIDRQLQYVDGSFCLCPVKTLKSFRTFIISNKLYEELEWAKTLQEDQKAKKGKAYRNTERVYDYVAKEWIIGGDFVNRKKNGELLTINSMKYWSKKIKATLGIDFKYHNLRHTFATECAANNVNQQMLMNMMGHKKIDTTQKYYINIANNRSLEERTQAILDTMFKPSSGLNFHDPK